ncbi:collagenase-like [Trichoplusia ni]|uniref:Collagenase-like n=1 Tax=Trichoplusia ni TaxID=7111 RepID=A0A7E5WCV6_TRINI|nr:collagenase-like [Trichoplusia ni]
MKVLLLVCLLGVVAAEERLLKYHELVGIPEAARIRRQESMRVVGSVGSYNGEHPFMAGLIITLNSKATSVCGGSLLNHYRVLTSGRCMDDGYYQAERVLVVLGSTKLFSGGTRVYANTAYLHPNFNASTFTDDIAMLSVPYISYNRYISPILLPYGISNTFQGYSSEIIGYGTTSDSASLNTGQSLRDTFVQVVSNSFCSQIYGSSITSDIMCTSGMNGKGACSGDYGGPLILRRYSGTGNQDLLVSSRVCFVLKSLQCADFNSYQGHIIEAFDINPKALKTYRCDILYGRCRLSVRLPNRPHPSLFIHQLDK